jgi:glycine amidinotransferase/scyllo-inosamine-4-phosphate amidinotransferase 1
MPVNSYNEWDPLKEVIVGSALHARLPYFDGGMNHLEPTTRDMFPSTEDRKYPEWMIQETEEDINIFVSVLEELNIVVHRPDPIEYNGMLKTPYWESDYYFQYPPRDILLTLGDQLIESPCAFRSRQFETLAYRSILINYFKNGGKWISAPKPSLRDELYTTDSDGDPMLRELEPVFDAANILRAGEDIIYLISCSGNKLGAQWLQQTIGDKFRVHVCHDLYKGTHIDTTLTLLRPGLLLANPERVNANNIPPPLKKWDVIYAPEMNEPSYSSYEGISSKWIGMNLLMLSPDLAVVDANQPELIKLLDKHKIDCIPLTLRHGRSLAGGFHCITVDVHRKGGLEKYS